MQNTYVVTNDVQPMCGHVLTKRRRSTPGAGHFCDFINGRIERKRIYLDDPELTSFETV